jgi:thiamine-phosphate pyrophosphorylase
MKLPEPGIYAILDGQFVEPGALSTVALGFARAGVRFVQLRHKSAPGRELCRMAEAVASALAGTGVPFLINDRVDVARISGAQGVHLGQDDVPPAAARAVLGPAAIIGWSTHDAEQARAAQNLPIDYIGFGPVFPTATKANADPVVGLEELARVAAASALPVVGIGGVGVERASAVRDRGARWAAVVSALYGASGPEACAAAVVRAWECGP